MRLKEIKEGVLTRPAEKGMNKTSAHTFYIEVDARDGTVEELLPKIVDAMSNTGIRAEISGKEGFKLESVNERDNNTPKSLSSYDEITKTEFDNDKKNITKNATKQDNRFGVPEYRVGSRAVWVPKYTVDGKTRYTQYNSHSFYNIPEYVEMENLENGEIRYFRKK